MLKKTLLLLPFLCSACIQLGGEAPPSAYYVLQPRLTAAAPTSQQALSIEIKLVDFPGYLERKNIVTKISGNRVSVAPDAFWAEAPADNLLHTLRRNVSALLPRARITLSPWEKNPSPDVKILLFVNRFGGELGNAAELEINWLVVRDQAAGAMERFSHRQSIGPAYTDLVDGLSHGLDKFSLLLAQNLSGAKHE